MFLNLLYRLSQLSYTIHHIWKTVYTLKIINNFHKFLSNAAIFYVIIISVTVMQTFRISLQANVTVYYYRAKWTYLFMNSQLSKNDNKI